MLLPYIRTYTSHAGGGMCGVYTYKRLRDHLLLVCWCSAPAVAEVFSRFVCLDVVDVVVLHHRRAWSKSTHEIANNNNNPKTPRHVQKNQKLSVHSHLYTIQRFTPAVFQLRTTFLRLAIIHLKQQINYIITPACNLMYVSYCTCRANFVI
jgi:hypothetical protein